MTELTTQTAIRLSTLQLDQTDRMAVKMLLQGFAPAVIWKSTALGNQREFLACLKRVREVIGVAKHADMLAWFNRPGDTPAPVPPPAAGVGAAPPVASAVSEPLATPPEPVTVGLKLKQTVWGFTYTRVEEPKNE